MKTTERPLVDTSKAVFKVGKRGLFNEYGGACAIIDMASRLGLQDEIDQAIHLLGNHAPYHESDHVLTIAINSLCEGRSLQDIERLRDNKALRLSFGLKRMPAPSTVGDFLHRFSEEAIIELSEAINRIRVKVWTSCLEPAQRRRAIIEGDGTIDETDGECKQGTDFAYNGKFGYHPLLISLANTGEPLYLVNRPGNRPSHDNAAAYFDRAIACVRQASFDEVLLRGDNDFSQTAHLDRWHDDGVRFLFGFDARKKLRERAAAFDEAAWKPLHRPPKYEVQTIPRGKRKNVKEEVVKRRNYLKLKTVTEDVVEFPYQPKACGRPYRMVVLRKRIEQWRGVQREMDKIEYFFFITNLAEPADEIVLLANKRCHQENIIEQLKNEVHALHAPGHTLVANNAYMVCAALAMTLKIWFALHTPCESARDRLLRMKYRRFLLAFVRLPCQIVQKGRRVIHRLFAPSMRCNIFLSIVERCSRIRPAYR